MSVDIGPGTRLLCVTEAPGTSLVKGNTYTCTGVFPATATRFCRRHGRDSQCFGVSLKEVDVSGRWPRAVGYVSCIFIPLGGDLPTEITRFLERPLDKIKTVRVKEPA